MHHRNSQIRERRKSENLWILRTEKYFGLFLLLEECRKYRCVRNAVAHWMGARVLYVFAIKSLLYGFGLLVYYSDFYVVHFIGLTMRVEILVGWQSSLLYLWGISLDNRQTDWHAFIIFERAGSVSVFNDTSGPSLFCFYFIPKNLTILNSTEDLGKCAFSPLKIYK